MPIHSRANLSVSLRYSGEGIEQIPFQWIPHFSQAANESTYIYLTVWIDTKTAGLKKDEELTFFGTVDGPEGKSEEFLKTIKPEKTKSDQNSGWIRISCHFR